MSSVMRNQDKESLLNIIFDLDDTLHDKSASLKTYAEGLLNTALNNLDLPKQQFVSEFVAQNNIIQPKSHVFRTLSERFRFSPHLERELLVAFDTSFHEFSVPFDGALSTLSMLKNSGVSIGCITNGRDFFQRAKIKALGFDEYFDFTITSGGVGVKKPDARIFEMGLGYFSRSDKKVCFCGDSLSSDMAPAKTLGLITVWKTEDKNKPDYVDHCFSTFQEFDQLWQTTLVYA
ncbi:2-haloalkanoic acid dehalogenase [Photobacterium aphoticum]|uniref:2-haloalkanoic acid dehalogenase n=1 Tax=Photobacterium aphoticum TaxID=754436 RepID=A0A090QY97_9GAMM|nr:2-haloalkanoic acid dehalogenase [Photobacterium aphoticum]